MSPIYISSPIYVSPYLFISPILKKFRTRTIYMAGSQTVLFNSKNTQIYIRKGYKIALQTKILPFKLHFCRHMPNYLTKVKYDAYFDQKVITPYYFLPIPHFIRKMCYSPYYLQKSTLCNYFQDIHLQLSEKLS